MLVLLQTFILGFAVLGGGGSRVWGFRSMTSQGTRERTLGEPEAIQGVLKTSEKDIRISPVNDIAEPSRPSRLRSSEDQEDDSTKELPMPESWEVPATPEIRLTCISIQSYNSVRNLPGQIPWIPPSEVGLMTLMHGGRV